jgi:hypothetical protein
MKIPPSSVPLHRSIGNTRPIRPTRKGFGTDGTPKFCLEPVGDRYSGRCVPLREPCFTHLAPPQAYYL